MIDEYTDSATTDHGGSGGFTVTFGFPDSGDYSWNVEGAADGHGESNTDGDIDRTCIPGGGAATSPVRRTGRADSHDKMVPLTPG